MDPLGALALHPFAPRSLCCSTSCPVVVRVPNWHPWPWIACCLHFDPRQLHPAFVQNEGRWNIDCAVEDQDNNSEHNHSHEGDFSFEMSELNTVIHEVLHCMFNKALSINSTALEDKNPETAEPEFVGSKTETALLRTKDPKWAPYQQTRSNADIVRMIPFSGERKAMGAATCISDNKDRFYIKGASEIVPKLCSRPVVVCCPGSETRADSREVETAPIAKLEENILRTIIFYANQMLRTLAIGYREFRSWSPAGHNGAIDEVPHKMIAEDLTLIGITGIEDPLCPGIKEAVAKRCCIRDVPG